ncbi:MAG: hypothetical protein AAF550_12405 [Myxococcota bacterium]
MSRLVAKYHMRSVTLPAGFDSKVGWVKGQEVMLQTRIFHGNAALGRLHICIGSGAMQSLTVLGIPSLTCGAPLLAIDYVRFGQKVAIHVLDLSPLSQAESTGDALLIDARRILGDSTTDLDMPSFCEGHLSAQAILVRSGDPERHMRAVERVVDGFDALLSRSEEVACRMSAVRAYLAAMRANKKEKKVLSRIFGEEFAHEFLDEHFFGEQVVARLKEPSLVS